MFDISFFERIYSGNKFVESIFSMSLTTDYLFDFLCRGFHGVPRCWLSILKILLFTTFSSNIY